MIEDTKAAAVSAGSAEPRREAPAEPQAVPPEALLPCPFCGEDADEIVWTETQDD